VKQYGAQVKDKQVHRCAQADSSAAKSNIAIFRLEGLEHFCDAMVREE
jgi:hypothetical protein